MYKIKLELKKSCNKKNYYQFTLIEVKYIDTYQVVSLNIILFNVFFQILKEKISYDQPYHNSMANCE